MVDRYKLRFGRYRTPRYTLGAKIECPAGGEVSIVGTTDACGTPQSRCNGWQDFYEWATPKV